MRILYLNPCGQMGGAIATLTLAYVVKFFGWDVPFFITAALCALGAALYCKIDIDRQVVS